MPKRTPSRARSSLMVRRRLMSGSMPADRGCRGPGVGRGWRGGRLRRDLRCRGGAGCVWVVACEGRRVGGVARGGHPLVLVSTLIGSWAAHDFRLVSGATALTRQKARAGERVMAEEGVAAAHLPDASRIGSSHFRVVNDFRVAFLGFVGEVPSQGQNNRSQLESAKTQDWVCPVDCVRGGASGPMLAAASGCGSATAGLRRDSGLAAAG